MPQRFIGKVVIVTGGSSGIGQATAVAFAEEGATVLVTGRHADTVEGATRLSAAITGIVADVTDPEDAKRVVQKSVELGGGVDILVNNAGIAIFEPLATLSVDASREQLMTNVLGLVVMTQAAVPSLIARQGNVVNIGSAAGRHARPGGSIYAATKAAVESLTRSWAAELAPQGVRVNAVAPGPVETPIFTKMEGPPDEIEARKQKLVTRVLLGRIGQPAEVARWVLHVADPASSWVNAQVIGVDGGMVS